MWRALLAFLALGTLKANPRVSTSPIPVYVRKTWRGSFFRAYFFCFFFSCEDRRQHTESTTLNTTPPHSSSGSRQHHICAHDGSSLCCSELFVSEPVVCHRTIPHISAVLPLRTHVHRSSHFGQNYMCRELENINFYNNSYFTFTSTQTVFYVQFRSNFFCRRFCPHHR